VAGLDDSPRIVTNASWALMTLSDQINDGMDDIPTGHLSPYYEGIVSALMRVTERCVFFHFSKADRWLNYAQDIQ
jgi:importin subunit beta-1